MVTSISAAELRDKIDRDEFVLFDTRNPEDFDGWHIAGAENVEYSCANDELVGEFDPDAYDDDEEIVVTCATGNSAEAFAEYLEELGFENVSWVDGGM